MRSFHRPFGIRRKLFLSGAALSIFALPIALSSANVNPIHTQSPPAFDPSEFKFEVASIKPTKTPDGGWYLNSTNDGIAGRNVPLDYLIHQAYGIYEKYRYTGAPNWLSSDCYDVEAKMESSVAERFRNLRRPERILAEQHMFQLLLAERFALKAHRETKEFPVYFLVVAKNGSKLQESKINPNESNASNNGSWGGGGTRDGVTTITANYVPVEQLASQLTEMVGRSVLDKTELTGRYDLTLKFTPEYIVHQATADGAPEGPSIFTALQDQLGLKLESGKGPIEIIVIDHVERASGN